MQYRKFGEDYVIRLDKGEEVLGCLKEFCEREDIAMGTVEGIGAADYAVIGLYDVPQRVFHSETLNGSMEISALMGNISRMDDETYLHIHATLCDVSLETRGGHISELRISSTCELAVRPMKGSATRAYDPDTGLNIYDF